MGCNAEPRSRARRRRGYLTRMVFVGHLVRAMAKLAVLVASALHRNALESNLQSWSRRGEDRTAMTTLSNRAQQCTTVRCLRRCRCGGGGCQCWRTDRRRSSPGAATGPSPRRRHGRRRCPGTEDRGCRTRVRARRGGRRARPPRLWSWAPCLSWRDRSRPGGAGGATQKVTWISPPGTGTTVNLELNHKSKHVSPVHNCWAWAHHLLVCKHSATRKKPSSV